MNVLGDEYQLPWTPRENGGGNVNLEERLLAGEKDTGNMIEDRLQTPFDDQENANGFDGDRPQVWFGDHENANVDVHDDLQQVWFGDHENASANVHGCHPRLWLAHDENANANDVYQDLPQL